MYYAASTFGSNHSVIGLATNSTLDPADPDYEWIDQGPVLESMTSDDFNAIDPGVVVDAEGIPWMAFGSFWSGIRMVQLEWPSGLRADPDGEPLRLVDRGVPPNAVEAPTIVEHEAEYFLFVSFDSCCQGLNSTYKVAVGRSDSVTGPYLDRDGTPLLSGGGTVLLSTEGARIGPGGESASNGYLAYHYYDGDAAGATRLAVSRIDWDAQGWPVVD
jgi:arabinan endo-1,5-alpha-L-arabinosidase